MNGSINSTILDNERYFERRGEELSAQRSPLKGKKRGKGMKSSVKFHQKEAILFYIQHFGYNPLPRKAEVLCFACCSLLK